MTRAFQEIIHFDQYLCHTETQSTRQEGINYSGIGTLPLKCRRLRGMSCLLLFWDFQVQSSQTLSTLISMKHLMCKIKDAIQLLQLWCVRRAGCFQKSFECILSNLKFTWHECHYLCSTSLKSVHVLKISIRMEFMLWILMPVYPSYVEILSCITYAKQYNYFKLKLYSQKEEGESE